MKRIINTLIFLLICMVSQATHNRAGQLLYKHITENTYEFTLTQFYTTSSPATEERIRTGVKVTWGDNTESMIQCIREEIEILPDNYTKCVFRERHTFPSTGTYTIIMEDANRNAGVVNIPESVLMVFAVKTVFRIDPNVRPNNAPELLTYPIDKAAVGRRFVHNPSAFDIDGDSLSYELAICLRERGKEIETYSFPEASNAPYIPYVENNGDLVWDAPVKAGIYNVAMRINEWRGVTKISSITRDIQIEVVDSKNNPPELPVFKDTCVVANEFISITFDVTDNDEWIYGKDYIKVTATGGPFLVDKPAKVDTVNVRGKTTVTFTWQTDVSHVRKQPYTVVFKAEDQNPDLKLVSFANYNITVIAPPVEILPAVAEKKYIQLEWNRTICDHASGYEIYRSIGQQDLTLGTCDTGIPAGSDYERVDALNGIDRTSYRDNNNGRGLSPGIEYCYRVVAIFSDGAKSLPSDETCASLLAGMPPIIQAHVETVDALGEIHVTWLEKPVKDLIDGLVDKKGPFEYRLFYTLDTISWPADPLYTSRFGDNDTSFSHKPIDTKTKFPYFYKVELWEEDGAIVDEDFEIASTLYPVLEPSDKSVIISFERYTPWINAEFNIYRCLKNEKEIPTEADFVDFTNRETFKDKGLKNGYEYCYLIKSTGYRNIEGVEYHNFNWSHLACVTPFDNVPPCEPELMAKSNCDENRNLLEWSYIPDCMYDMEKFHIYYTINPYKIPDPQKDERIGTINRDENWHERITYTWEHIGTLLGCYYVTAVDSAGNESKGSNLICLDECGEYELPNVFTPNGDNINDVFKSYNPGGVTRVDMKIYNRTGKLVYKTEDPDINWDGRDIDSKRFVSSGVYYYICDVFEERLTGSKNITLSGFIHVYYGRDAKPYTSPSD